MSEAIFVPVVERLRTRARYYRSKGLDTFASELEAEALDAERMLVFGTSASKRRPAVVTPPLRPTPRTPPVPRDLAWVSVNQACAIAAVSRRTIYNWIGAGKITVKHTIGGSPRILQSSLWREAR